MTPTTTTAPHLDPERRHDVVILFDVTDGNPNGDPDADNEPRTDPLTNQGLVTDVALKRKIRDTIAARHAGADGYGIWISRGATLNDAIEAARKQTKTTKTTKDTDAARTVMCQNFWDVRIFGGVMSTGEAGGAGRATGPYQLTFARSIDPITPERHTIGRVASTADETGQTLGAKWTVPYAMYRAHGFWSPGNAARTGATADDLAALWDAQQWMFTDDRSAARGLLALRAVLIFSHTNPHGDAHAHDLFDLVTVTTTEDPPRATDHYALSLPGNGPTASGEAAPLPAPNSDITLTIQYLSPALRAVR